MSEQPPGHPASGDPDDDGSDNGGSSSNPFAAFPMFGDIARQLQGQGPLNWEAAKQFAMLGATQGNPESNIDPTIRIAFSELARIAALQVNDITKLDLTFPEHRVVTRGQWTSETLDAYRPLFTDLATSLGQSTDAAEIEATDDPMAQMMASLNQMVAPAMLGMAVGSMIGSLAQRVFGLHDLPIPRRAMEVVLVSANIDEFAAKWGLKVDEVRLWVVAHEMAGYSIFSLTHIRDGLAELVRRHVGAFRPDPAAIGDKLSRLEMSGDPMAAVQQAFSDPAILLGAVSSPEQRSMQPQLDAAVSMVVGYTDWVVDAVAVRLIGGEALSIADAARQVRLDSATEDAFIESLLGIRVGDDQVGRGKQFIQGVVDRVGEDGLNDLLNDPDALPTAAELEAPGLWIARVGET